MPDEPMFDAPMDVFAFYGALQKEDLTDFTPEEAEKLYDDFIAFAEEHHLGFGGGIGNPHEDDTRLFQHIIIPGEPRFEFIKPGLTRIICDILLAETEQQLKEVELKEHKSPLDKLKSIFRPKKGTD